MMKKIGLGGGCHWCTEAVFQSLKGVAEVQQGWIASESPYNAFSEAVVISYEEDIITLRDLISIHLYTHSATSNHSMRNKYRSAVYWFSAEDEPLAKTIIESLASQFTGNIITQVLPFATFKASLPEHQNYYYANPQKPFCTVYINPKLQLLQKKFSKYNQPTWCYTAKSQLAVIR